MTKQKTDWEKEFDNTFVNIRNDIVPYLKDFSRQLLTTQRRQLIKGILKDLDFYDWKGNIKTVELKEYLKSL